MVRWIAGMVLAVALFACSGNGSQPSAASMGGTSGTSGTASSTTGTPAQTTPTQTVGAAGASAGSGAVAAPASGPMAAGASAGTSSPAAPGGAGATASTGQAGAGAPASAGTISIMVTPDREHLYEDDSKWLCLPGKDQLCTSNLDATVLNADGTMEVEHHVPATDPSFDCFYVYPNVSNDSGPVSDWMPGTEETDCVNAQAGRYSRVCRVFAPLYRQITLSALNGGAMPTAADRSMGYQDVIAAFNHYLTHYNQGRGFVLIGHSQGSGVLLQASAWIATSSPTSSSRS